MDKKFLILQQIQMTNIKLIREKSNTIYKNASKSHDIYLI